jgi:peptidoglycan/LPS O-acetylase OafA/YrhL/lysophospholipase L1-like esterase
MTEADARAAEPEPEPEPDARAAEPEPEPGPEPEILPIAPSRHEHRPRTERKPRRPRPATPPREPLRIPHEPALDGLRGMAVLAVVLYHLDRAGHTLPWAAGGFLGVDAFFVLSGFLITSLLLVEWLDSGTIRLREFWSRRARRLLPALFLVLLVVVLYAALVAQPTELQSLRWDGISTLFYVANWRFIADKASYFDAFITESPLTHMWSLAIEEQWYLFWPLVLLAILKWKRSLKWVIGLCVTLALASAAWMAVLHQPGTDPSRVYFGTDTRAQSLLVGAILAAVLIRGLNVRERTARYVVPTLGVLAGLGVLVGWALVPDKAEWIYRGGFLIFAIGVAVVILAAVQPEGNPVRTFLSLRLLRWLGLISYGVYLWHWPIFVMVRPATLQDHLGVRPTGAALLVIRVALTLGISIASYFLIERPIRTGWLKDRIRFSPALVPAMAVILLFLMLAATRGAFDPYTLVASKEPQDRPLPTLEDLQHDLDPETRPAPDSTDEASFDRVLIVGDSVANTMAEGFTRERQQNSHLLVWNQTVLFCQLLNGPRWENGEWVDEENTCDDWEKNWHKAVDEFDPDVVVLAVGAWEIFDREVDGERFLFGTDEFDQLFLTTLTDAIDTLSSDGATVVLLTTPRFERQDDVSASVWTQNDRWRTDHLNDLFKEAAEQRPNQVELVDLGGFVCPDPDVCIQRLDDGSPVRFDGLHFSEEGAQVVADWLTPRLQDAADAHK